MAKSSWATFGVRPPAPGSTKSVQRRFVRDMQLRSLPFSVLGLAVVIVVGLPAWLIILMAVTMVALVLDLVWLTVRILRDRER